MKTHEACTSDGLLRNPADFSLVLGGPLFQLLRRAHLSDDALLLVRQRIVVIALLVWLPLLVLVVVFVLCLVIVPLLVFAPQLAQVKRTGLREYGTLAERYVRAFDAKWLRGGVSADEPFVGSGDIQSLADLGNSYEVVRTMRIMPVTREAIIGLGAATLVPVVPLALTMMPLEELLKKLFGILF